MRLLAKRIQLTIRIEVKVCVATDGLFTNSTTTWCPPSLCSNKYITFNFSANMMRLGGNSQFSIGVRILNLVVSKFNCGLVLAHSVEKLLVYPFKRGRALMAIGRSKASK